MVKRVMKLRVDVRGDKVTVSALAQSPRGTPYRTRVTRENLAGVDKATRKEIVREMVGLVLAEEPESGR